MNARKPRVLVGCEVSGIVRDSFSAAGWDAWSCDIGPSSRPGRHIECDLALLVKAMKPDDWDLFIVHPPCRYLSVSGMHWTTRGLRDPAETERALDFVRLLLAAPVRKIALENPVGIISTRIRKPTQWVQPWEFGDPESKKTGLWLKGLPKLVPTNVLPLPACGHWANQTPSGQNKLGPSPERAAKRAVTYGGLARAMASQWGTLDSCFSLT